MEASLRFNLPVSLSFGDGWGEVFIRFFCSQIFCVLAPWGYFHLSGFSDLHRFYFTQRNKDYGGTKNFFNLKFFRFAQIIFAKFF
jgi:hypothetical protein